MYYYGGYQGGTGSCGCQGNYGYNYPMYNYGCGCQGGYGNNYAIILVLFILLVIIIGTRFTV